MEWAKTVGDVIRADLDGPDKAVLLAILANTNPGREGCDASVAELLVAASCSKRTFERAMDRLVGVGVIRRVKRGSRGALSFFDPGQLPKLVQQTRSTREAKAALPKPKVPKGKLKAYQELVELCPEPGCPLKAHVASLEAQQEEVSRESVSDMLF